MSPVTDATLSGRIRRILRERRLKQTDFARALGISANYVYLLTSGRKRTLSEPLARLIGTTYGYPPAWILHGEGALDVSDAPDADLIAETVRLVQCLDEDDLYAVAAFVRGLEHSRPPDKGDL